jgi:hypothetical protein
MISLAELSFCYLVLNQMSEAVTHGKEHAQVMRKLHGDHHPLYADSLVENGLLLFRLKQFAEAERMLQQAHTIFRTVLGKKHTKTVSCVEALHAVRCNFLAQPKGKQNLQVEFSESRMCNHCGTVGPGLLACKVCRSVWYCDQGCQRAHWPTHKPLCSVCSYCGKGLPRMLCSRCQKAMYCGRECSKAHWSQHKKECGPPPAK